MKTGFKTILTSAAVATALSATLISGPAAAQKVAVAASDALEVSRDSVELRDVLIPRPDYDTTNTALVFTNPTKHDLLVVCAARDANGEAIGRAKTKVPAHGVRFILASDISNGEDYIGSAKCKSRRSMIPTAFILNGAIADVPANARRRSNVTTMTFPIIASF